MADTTTVKPRIESKFTSRRSACGARRGLTPQSRPSAASTVAPAARTAIWAGHATSRLSVTAMRMTSLPSTAPTAIHCIRWRPKAGASR